MKSVAEIAIIGLIGTFTIVAGIIIPPSVIKSTIGKEILLTYNFEKAQYGLITFLSSTQDDKIVYELVGTKILLKDVDISEAQNTFNKVIATNYCIVVDPEIRGMQGAQGDISNTNICEVNAAFNTIMVVPYNNEALVKVIGMGVE